LGKPRQTRKRKKEKIAIGSHPEREGNQIVTYAPWWRKSLGGVGNKKGGAGLGSDEGVEVKGLSVQTSLFRINRPHHQKKKRRRGGEEAEGLGFQTQKTKNRKWGGTSRGGEICWVMVKQLGKRGKEVGVKARKGLPVTITKEPCGGGKGVNDPTKEIDFPS